MKRLGSWLCLALVVVGLLSVPLVAQKTSGTIRGVVTDPSGAVVANVPVSIKNNSASSSQVLRMSAFTPNSS